MAILAKHLLDGGEPRGVIMHQEAVHRWAPECGRPSPVISSVRGFIGPASPLYPKLGARRPGKALRRRLAKKCSFCGTKRALTLHHLVRREWGGATEPENLLCLCRDCHDRVHRGELNDRELIWGVGAARIERMLGDLQKRPAPNSGLQQTPPSLSLGRRS